MVLRRKRLHGLLWHTSAASDADCRGGFVSQPEGPQASPLPEIREVKKYRCLWRT